MQAEATFVQHSGCKMPWMSSNATTKVCESAKSLQQLYNVMSCTTGQNNEFCPGKTTELQFNNLTQCPREQPCKLWIFTYYDIKDPTSGRELLKLNLDSDYVVMVTDIWSYDFQSLFGEVGGTMGLLMGISFAHIFQFLGSLKHQFHNWMNNMKK